jgi:N utilization substance protein A
MENDPPDPGDDHPYSFSAGQKRSPSCSLDCHAVSGSQIKVARQGRRNMTKRDRKKRMETGPDSAGQGGATQQISDMPIADSESVEELAEEGNAFEADAIYGVENASDPDVSEVITHEIPEDDVPGEYLDNDEHLA